MVYQKWHSPSTSNNTLANIQECIIFKSDWIYNMRHQAFLVLIPCKWQINYKIMSRENKIMPKQAETKGDAVVNQQNYNY